MMSDIVITRLAYWKAEIDVNGKKLYVKDYWLKDYRESKRYLWVSRLTLWLGGIIAFSSFLFLIGLVGRSDYMAEVGILDDWGFWDYMFKMIEILIIAAVGGIIVHFASPIESYYSDKVSYLRRYRNSR